MEMAVKNEVVSWKPRMQLGSGVYRWYSNKLKHEKGHDAEGKKENEDDMDATRGQKMAKAAIPAAKSIIALVKEYGAAGIAVYFIIWAITITMFYIALNNGFFNRGDAKVWMRSWGLDKFFDVELLGSQKSIFVIAFIMTKFTEPLRIMLTIGLTARFARFYRGPATKMIQSQLSKAKKP